MSFKDAANIGPGGIPHFEPVRWRFNPEALKAQENAAHRYAVARAAMENAYLSDAQRTELQAVAEGAFRVSLHDRGLTLN